MRVCGGGGECVLQFKRDWLLHQRCRAMNEVQIAEKEINVRNNHIICAQYYNTGASVTFSLWMQMKFIVNVYLITRISSPLSTMTPLEKELVSCSEVCPSCTSISAVSCSVVAAVSCTNVFG